MTHIDYKLAAGAALKCLIKKRYASQQEFADDFGIDLRTVNRYVTIGLSDTIKIQEIADFFDMDLIQYFTFAKEIASKEGAW